MIGALHRIWHLGIKELRSLKADPVLALLIVYTFTFGVYASATGSRLEVRNASVAVVDEDRSALSFRLADALLPPYFQAPVPIEPTAVDAAMDRGTYVFVVEIPPRFEADVLSGVPATIGLAVDATAMAMAGNGAAYISSIIARAGHSARRDQQPFVVEGEYAAKTAGERRSAAERRTGKRRIATSWSTDARGR